MRHPTDRGAGIQEAILRQGQERLWSHLDNRSTTAQRYSGRQVLNSALKLINLKSVPGRRRRVWLKASPRSPVWRFLYSEL